MKKITVFIIFIIILSVSGCAGIPAPEKLTSDDCLVLIKTRIENPDHATVARTFSFLINGVNNPVVVSQKKDSFVAIKIRKDKTNILAIISDVTKEGFEGDITNTELNITLPYESEKVIVADIVFVQKYKHVSSKQTTVAYEFERITEKEREILLSECKDSNKFLSWWE